MAELLYSEVQVVPLRQKSKLPIRLQSQLTPHGKNRFFPILSQNLLDGLICWYNDDIDLCNKTFGSSSHAILATPYHSCLSPTQRKGR